METWFIGLLGPTWGFVVSSLIKIVIILAPLILCVAYMTYFERKVIGFMQLRVGGGSNSDWLHDIVSRCLET